MATAPRTRLIEAAKTLFHRRGYEAVSLYDIAAAAGMKQGHVYYYFKTKRELALAALEDWRMMAQALFAELGMVKEPRRRVAQFLDHAAEISPIYSKWGCPIAGLSASMAAIAPDVAGERFAPVYPVHLDFLQDAFRAMGLNERRAKVEARALLAGLQGSIHLSHVMGNRRILLDFVTEQKNSVQRLRP